MAKNKRGQGEGSIRERFKKTKDGKKVSIGWEARYTVGKKADGTPNRKSIYGKTSVEVKKALRKVLTEIDTGVYIEPSKLPVSDWLDTWLMDYKKQSVKIKTFTSYQDTVRLHIKPEIGPVNLKDLQAPQVQHLISGIKDKGLSPRMAKYVYTILTMALKQAIKSNLLIKNVCDAVTLPKQTKGEIRVLTVKEQDTFTEAVRGHRLEAAFILDLFTGLRIGELLALKWSDIDLKEGVLKVRRNVQRVRIDDAETKTQLVYGEPKTESGKRSIPLLDEVVEILKEHKKRQLAEEVRAGPLYDGKKADDDSSKKRDKDDRLVFCTELGKQLEIRNFQRTFYELVEKANLKKVNFHALRHTFATRGLENGIEPKVMQELLGHASIIMTLDIYSHVMPEKKKESMNKLKVLFKTGTT